MDARRRPAGTDFTLEELKTIAAEAGIHPDAVTEAARPAIPRPQSRPSANHHRLLGLGGGGGLWCGIQIAEALAFGPVVGVSLMVGGIGIGTLAAAGLWRSRDRAVWNGVRRVWSTPWITRTRAVLLARPRLVLNNPEARVTPIAA